MERKAISGIMLTLLLTSMLTLTFSIQPVKASRTIYIRADGSIYPSTAPIQRDGNVYTFTDNIYDSIVVQKDNIVIDGNGYAVEGTGAEYSVGIELIDRKYVAIKNVLIKSFYWGIYSELSSYCTISNVKALKNVEAMAFWGSYNSTFANNIVANNTMGIGIIESSNNVLIDNLTTNNTIDGISLWVSDLNYVVNNTVNNNTYGILLDGDSNNNYLINNLARDNKVGIQLQIDAWGIPEWFVFPDANVIVGNVVTNNSHGIKLVGKEPSPGLIITSGNNSIYHNNFIKNLNHVSISFANSTWDSGYPFGGNYWSDYSGADANSDGIGDTPYVIDPNNQDNYPLINPYIAGDINYDGTVNVLDLYALGKAYGATLTSPNWNVRADTNDDNIIDNKDLTMLVQNYGKTNP